MFTHEFQRYTELYKAVNGMTPNYIQDLFEVKKYHII